MIFTVMASKEASLKSPRRGRNRGCKRKSMYAESDDHIEEMPEGGGLMVDDDDDFRRMSVKRRKTRKDQKSTTSKKAKGPSRRGANSTKDVAFQKKQSSKKTDKGKTKHVSYLKKKEIDSIVSTLKKIELVPMKNCVLDLLKKEKHIEQNDRRKGILEDLKKTVAMSKLVSQLFSKCISLLKAGLSYNSNDRHAKYRIAYTFYVRDALSDRSSQVMKWFE